MTETEKVLALDLEHLTPAEMKYLHDLRQTAQLRVIMRYLLGEKRDR